MCDYFLMSMRLDKKRPEDFGLVETNNSEFFLRPEDNSLWRARTLYDFGWGKENGYYKIPMPGFKKLIDIILQSKNKEDKYGAASVILDDYCDELSDKCFEIFEDEKNTTKYFEFFKILNLQNPINRSSIVGKSHSNICNDFNKWKNISNRVSLLYKKQKIDDNQTP